MISAGLVAATVDFDPSLRSVLFVASNIIIPLGYLFIAFFVMPILPVSNITRWGARAFFILCALTHIDQAAHTILTPGETYGEVSQELHMLLVHIPQAVAVWVFAVGFFVDLRRLRSERGNVAAAVQADASSD